MYILVAKQLLTMTIIGLGGFIFAKIFKVNDDQQKFMSKLLLYFINPFMLLTVFNKDFDSEKFTGLIFVFFVALLVHGVMILLGIFTSKNKIDRIAVVFTNCGFVGIPLIRGVFGDEGVFYLMGYIAIFNVLVWTYGYHQVSGKINLKKVITNPNIVGVVIGIILYCSPWTLPEVIAKPVALIGDLNTAVSMILIGILLANFNGAEAKSYVFRIVKVSVLRLIVTGIVNIGVLYIVYRLFPNIPDIRMLLFVVLIASLCPIATSIPGIACLFDKDSTYASLIVSITSVLCIATLPTIIALAELVIK